MQSETKTKEQLLIEIKELHKRLAECGKHKSAQTDPADLRCRADDQLKTLDTEMDQGQTNDMERLYHQLQVHQIALEMKKEELHHALIQIEESRTKYSDLYDFAPVGYLTLDKEGLVLEANLTVAQQLGVERSSLVGRSIMYFIDMADRNALYSHLKTIFKYKKRQTCEVKCLKGVEGHFHALFDTMLVEYSGGNGQLMTSVTDITEKNLASHDSHVQRETLAGFFEIAPYIVMLVNKDGRVTYINHKGAAFSGKPKAELLGLLGGEVFNCLNSFDGLGCGRNAECRDCPVRTRVMYTFKTRQRVNEAESRMTIRKGSTDVAVDMLITTVLIEEIEQVLITITDITERKRSEIALRESEKRFSRFFCASPVGTSITRLRDGGFVDANDAFLGLFGYTRQEVIGQTSLKLKVWNNPEDRTKMIDILQQQGRIKDFETRFRKKSGEIMDVLLSAEVIEMAGERHILNLSYDVTERKRTEKAMLKANRVINALWECNNALIHVKDELQLLHEICRVIVELGGYRMAWVGYAEQDADKSVTPVAQYGYEDGYLEEVNVTWKDTERGRGPAGTCIRTGAPSVVRNVERQEEFAPWREEAIKRKYASVIGLPLLLEDKMLGSLTIYGTESDAFDQDEVNLLSKLAMNLSFGIETLRNSKARKQSEIDLRRAHDELGLRVQERTAALENANKELRQVPSKLIAVQEEERKRLASELHDSIGQTLAALKYWVEMVLNEKDMGEGNAAFDHLEQFIPILQRSIEETRNIYMDLRPTILDDMGLLAALEWLRQQRMKIYPQCHIELEVGITEEEIPESLKINIFRIVQEALNNTAKHSGAEWADISISKNGSGIHLVISDDGVGMDLDVILQNAFTTSLGLTSMRERAELSEGRFSIESSPGEGTTIQVHWPNGS
jgi:PAS domain S-box-containing protein